MDFSEYAAPSKQWLALLASDPTPAPDSFKPIALSAVEEHRTAVNKLTDDKTAAGVAAVGLDARVQMETLEIPSSGQHLIRIRRYMPRENQPPAGEPSVLIYFHGGGFVYGNENKDAMLCGGIAAETGLTLISVNYRHAPKHKHPAQHEDAWDAFTYVCDHGSKLGVDSSNGILLMGESSGANLAAGVAFQDLRRSNKDAAEKAGKKRAIAGLVLIVPFLIHMDNYPFHLFAAPEKASLTQCKDASVIPEPVLKMLLQCLGGDTLDPRLNIGLAPDEQLENWPKTGFIIAGMDPLRDEGLYFAKRLDGLGIPTRVRIFPGLPHGIKSWPQLPANKTMGEQISSSVKWLVGLEGDETEKWVVVEE